MTLSAPAERELLHSRDYAFRGYRRGDGLWDIEGRLTDTKSYAFANAWRGEIAPGTPVHDMWIRLTLDDALVVRDIEVRTEAAPFSVCGDIAPDFAAVKGLSVAPGWRKRVNELLGGVKGCTHLVEMLGAMATVAFQTIYPAQRRARGAMEADEGKVPPMLDACHALARDGDVVKQHWPKYYRERSARPDEKPSPSGGG
jgi:hypothetical protein